MLIGQDSVNAAWSFSVTDSGEDIIVPTQAICSSDNPCDDNGAGYYMRRVFATGSVSDVNHDLSINYVFGSGQLGPATAIMDLVYWNFTTSAAGFA